MSDISVQIEKNPDDATVVAKVIGSMNIANVTDLLKGLVSAFEQGSKVTVDLSAVTEIDTAGLQLLCSSHRSSIADGKELRIVARNQPVILEAAKAAGHFRTTGCAVDTCNSCLWIESN
jgi:anti-sigma B factor antagonist